MFILDARAFALWQRIGPMLRPAVKFLPLSAAALIGACYVNFANRIWHATFCAFNGSTLDGGRCFNAASDLARPLGIQGVAQRAPGRPLTEIHSICYMENDVD